jgi:hypothetical protein
MAHTKQRVCLTTDLTRYDSRLVAGSLGWTTVRRAQWGVIVEYDNGAVLDTLWKSLREVVEQKTVEQLWTEFAQCITELKERGVQRAEFLKRLSQEILPAHVTGNVDAS